MPRRFSGFRGARHSDLERAQHREAPKDSSEGARLTRTRGPGGTRAVCTASGDRACYAGHSGCSARPRKAGQARQARQAR